MDGNSKINNHEHTENLNDAIIQKYKIWVDLPETRNILSTSVSRSFINIPYENYKFNLRRMNTIDTADLINKQKLCELPKIVNKSINSEENINDCNETDQIKSVNGDIRKNNNCNLNEIKEDKKKYINGIKVKNQTYLKNDDTNPSFGTQFHEKGTCNPCRYEWTRGCHMGRFCRFCHHSSHVPLGTERVVPDPKILATTKVRPENILTFRKFASYATSMNSLLDANSPNHIYEDKVKTYNNSKMSSPNRNNINNANNYKNGNNYKNNSNFKKTSNYKSVNNYKSIKVYKNTNIYKNSDNYVNTNNLDNTGYLNFKYYNDTNYFNNYENLSNCYNRTKLLTNNKDNEFHKTLDTFSNNKDTLKNFKELNSFTRESALKTINSYQRIKLVS
ncbi:conserved Plasmodium protein, unknown function [Plasmodium gallinaceum]|uniref:C3H1-type domain-containing protein n=1 Tax=Plasmodium gallinaceum TaxID=5849 RepID=A0A1J1GP84_PLAGA|nr:conserved Plasmodium protein, unknown function [Plasmodium gallinaceum]CRG94303.1 conserved Plasmodium protein, unknown function [Plasmodium gallinaceum]